MAFQKNPFCLPRQLKRSSSHVVLSWSLGKVDTQTGKGIGNAFSTTGSPLTKSSETFKMRKIRMALCSRMPLSMEVGCACPHWSSQIMQVLQLYNLLINHNDKQAHPIELDTSFHDLTSHLSKLSPSI